MLSQATRQAFILRHVTNSGVPPGRPRSATGTIRPGERSIYSTAVQSCPAVSGNIGSGGLHCVRGAILFGDATVVHRHRGVHIAWSRGCPPARTQFRRRREVQSWRIAPTPICRWHRRTGPDRRTRIPQTTERKLPAGDNAWRQKQRGCSGRNGGLGNREICCLTGLADVKRRENGPPATWLYHAPPAELANSIRSSVGY